MSKYNQLRNAKEIGNYNSLTKDLGILEAYYKLISFMNVLRPSMQMEAPWTRTWPEAWESVQHDPRSGDCGSEHDSLTACAACAACADFLLLGTWPRCA